MIGFQIKLLLGQTNFREIILISNKSNKQPDHTDKLNNRSTSTTTGVERRRILLEKPASRVEISDIKYNFFPCLYGSNHWQGSNTMLPRVAT